MKWNLGELPVHMIVQMWKLQAFLIALCPFISKRYCLLITLAVTLEKDLSLESTQTIICL